MDPDKKILLQQLHFYQEELEGALLDLAWLRKKILGTRGIESRMVEADSLELGWAHEEPPHRHLNFTLRNVRHPGREYPKLFLRLLEHNTLPGLGVFSPIGCQDPPLKLWNPDGVEADREYMLFIPRDQHNISRLQKTSTMDFVLLRESALMIFAYLASYKTVSCNNEVQAWQLVAGCFLEELESTQDRMHYDFANISCKPRSNPPVISIKLANVFFASRFVSHLELVWRTGPKCELVIRSKSAGHLLFPDWHAPSECSEREVIFPFGLFIHSKVKRDIWEQLKAKDRAYMLGLAALLPDLVAHCIQQNPELERSHKKLLREAEYISAESRRLSIPEIPNPFLRIFSF